MERATNPGPCSTTSHGLGLRGFFVLLDHRAEQRTLFLVGNVDNEDAHRIARRCVGTG